MAAKKSKVTEAIKDVASDRAKRQAGDVKNGLDALFKRMSCGSVSNVDEYIPTGLEVLDRHVLGTGGWPVKRSVELFSPPSGGKSSLLYAAMANAQRLGGAAVLVETESALQLSRLTVFGVDLSTAYLLEPDTIEAAIDALRDALGAMPTDGPNLIGYDSLAMSSLADTVDKGRAGRTMGVKAKLLGEQLPPLMKLAATKRSCFIIVNHTKEKLGLVFGDKTTTPGGSTPKYAATIRCQLWNGTRIKQGENTVGIDGTISCVKNKIAVPHRKAKIRLMFETGWDDVHTTVAFAKDQGVIKANARVSAATYNEAREALGWPAKAEVSDQVDRSGIVETDDELDQVDSVDILPALKDGDSGTCPGG